jgi:hypothetical protein
MKRIFRVGLFLIPALVAVALSACREPAAYPRPAATGQGQTAGRPLTRLLFQDQQTCSLKWADVRIDDQDQLSLGAVADVAGFKQLDPAAQKLVQMRECHGLVLVGVRDNAAGGYESGWVLLHTGVGYIDHGDHGHWTFTKKPAVWDSRLDTEQGNPAHVYVYNGRFFLAHDRRNGYSRIDPIAYTTSRGRKPGPDRPRFLAGGGNHITLAVVDDKVGYSCWIAGGGPNQGRVDVTPVTEQARTEPAYSFTLPSGGIHGAIANSGKVFFAPADGVCWVEADLEARLQPQQVQVHHLALGKDGDKPRRTGAFTNHGKYVLFVTGKEASSALVLLDATANDPQPITVALNVQKGTRALTPAVAVTPEGKAYAFVFHDHDKAVDVEDVLEVVDLDPNGDGDCTDGKVLKRLKVGKSAVEGHYGHHDVAFDADGRFGFFTNPGDGTISALSLRTLEVAATFAVGGMPTHVVARGGKETDD